MHSYSLDTPVRRRIYVTLALLAMAIPTFLEKARTLLGLPSQYGFALSFSTSYGILYFIVNRWGWRWFASVLGIPDLNGRWNAKGKSSYKDPKTGECFEFQMEITVKQTLSQIEIFTKTGDSTSRSTMASISTQHAVPIFRYAYENEPKSLANQELQRHPGMASLRIEGKDALSGDYFSGKHRLRFGELTMERC